MHKKIDPLDKGVGLLEKRRMIDIFLKRKSDWLKIMEVFWRFRYYHSSSNYSKSRYVCQLSTDSLLQNVLYSRDETSMIKEKGDETMSKQLQTNGFDVSESKNRVVQEPDVREETAQPVQSNLKEGLTEPTKAYMERDTAMARDVKSEPNESRQETSNLQPVRPSYQFCPRCGRALPSDAVHFCPACGCDVYKVMASYTETSQKAVKDDLEDNNEIPKQNMHITQNKPENVNNGPVRLSLVDRSYIACGCGILSLIFTVMQWALVGLGFGIAGLIFSNQLHKAKYKSTWQTVGLITSIVGTVASSVMMSAVLIVMVCLLSFATMSL